MTAAALDLPGAAPLPIVPPPFHDELPISWLRRVGHANDMRLDYLLDHIGVSKRRLWRIDVQIDALECASIASATRRPPASISAMTISALPETARGYTSLKRDFQFCPQCVYEFHKPAGIAANLLELKYFELPVTLRHWRHAWSVRCDACGERLEPLRCDPLSPLSNKPEHKIRQKLIDKGAEILRFAGDNENRRLLHRIHLTLNFCCWLRESGPVNSMLMTSDIATRYAGFRAIVSSQDQPLRKIAWLLAISHRRRSENIMAALKRSRHMMRSIRDIAWAMSGHAFKWRFGKHRRRPEPIPAPRRTPRINPRRLSVYERAARLALKENAKLPPGKLLRRADQILRDLRRRSNIPNDATRSP